MRTKTRREIKIEIAENPIPIEKALDRLAKVIAAGMLREEREREERKA